MKLNSIARYDTFVRATTKDEKKNAFTFVEYHALLKRHFKYAIKFNSITNFIRDSRSEVFTSIGPFSIAIQFAINPLWFIG